MKKLYVVIYVREGRAILSGVYKTREEAEMTAHAIKNVEGIMPEIWTHEEEEEEL